MRDGDEDTLADAFWSVARRLRHLTHETTAPLGITPAQARALTVLRRHGAGEEQGGEPGEEQGLRLSELSHHLRIAPRSGTEVIDALEEAGLVRRDPDPADRRAVRVTLTAEGEKLTEALRKARSTEAQAFFGRLSEPDRENLARILRELRI